MTDVNPVGITRVQIVGLGLIGASIGLATRQLGYYVTGYDINSGIAEVAAKRGAVDSIGLDMTADVVFIAVPVSGVVGVAKVLLTGENPVNGELSELTEMRKVAEAAGVCNPEQIITDVAGIKSGVMQEIRHPRFIGGHPMAGSERLGPLGADEKLFYAATWVLTPTKDTDSKSFAILSSLIRQLGAEAVALEPDRHDELVATVSHVPHTVAANLMLLAQEQSFREAALLRLAAGGFRDMTRISAGDPLIWPEVLIDNKAAVVNTLEQLEKKLSKMRSMIEEGDREGIYNILKEAQGARRNLPQRANDAKNLAEVAVNIPDRPGVLAEITTSLGRAAINLYNLEILHVAEEAGGVLVMVIDADDFSKAKNLLSEKNYQLYLRYSGDK
ncbi:MAG: prephenate dehydrogenase/arogenate dehydrogenase family protein [Firmicutes bacterium]|jgi:prephenate dehydrogenase|nr:prephenate dehydrogenase/arogenate dehydrogenase family protein [Bacillota bacterium]